MRRDKKISLCGDICSVCPRYLATRNEDISQLNKLAKLWFRLNFRPYIASTEEMKCNGCSRIKPCNYKINTCKHIHLLNNCGECRHYPCAKIEDVFQKSERIKSLCIEKCDRNEYNVLQKAFLMKKEVLNNIHKKHFATQTDRSIDTTENENAEA